MIASDAFRVLFVSGQDGGTRRYRCFHPQEQLEGQGIATGFREATDYGLLVDALDYDVFILHRVPYSDLIGRLLALVHQQGKIAIFETDDLVFEPDLVQHDGFYQKLPPARARRYLRKVHRHLRTLDHCDYALTTTEYLAGWLRRRGKQTYVSRNALSDELLRLSEEAYRKRRPEGERVVIAYLSGSPSHDRDFAVAAPAVLSMMARHPQVALRVFGHLTLDGAFASFGERVQRVPYMAWQALPVAIGEVDVNLAPLELDNPFCRSKSELKYFEAGAVGVPTVATPTGAFQFAITHGENGLLARDTDEWIRCLERLIAEPERRQALGTAARQDVLENYTPRIRGPQFARLLRDLVARHRPEPSLDVTTAAAERRVIHHLGEVLTQLTSPAGSAQPSLEDDALWRQNNLALRLQEALAVVRRQRRRTTARLRAWVRHWIKSIARRVYRLELEGRRYRLLGELTQGQVYGQTFRAVAPNLSAVEVLFATFDRVNTPDVVFRLKTSPTAETDLVTRTVSASLRHDNRFCPFSFEPLPDSEGRVYYFSVESPGAVRGDALGLWEQLDPGEAEGRLYENDRPVAGRLAHVVRYDHLRSAQDF